MRHSKNIFYSLLLTSFTFLAACGTTTDPAEMYRGESADQIFQGGESALRSKDYKEAVKRFEALDAQYPFGRNAEVAELHIIYAYYESGDYLSAEAAADRFIHSHPADPHVDYAYYMRGLSNYYQNMGVFEKVFSIDFATRDLTQVKKSFTDFSELVTRYPDSRYAPPAHQYMVYLRNVLADHQLMVARYYYEHEAYVASANRASLVVQYYQGAPAVPDALVMMVKSYEHLQMTALQEQTINVIRYNYPDSVYLEQVTQEKFAHPTTAPIARTDVVSVSGADKSQLAMNQKMYPGNGSRSTAPVALNAPFHSLAESGLFQTHPKPVAPAPGQSADVMPPESPHNKLASLAPAANQLQKQANAQTMPTKTQAVATASATNSNGARSGHGIGLGDLFNSMSQSSLFALHKKPATSQQPAAPQQAQATTAPAPADQQVAEADSSATVAAKNVYPFPSNGTR